MATQDNSQQTQNQNQNQQKPNVSTNKDQVPAGLNKPGLVGTK